MYYNAAMKNTILQKIEATPAKSAWKKGVKAYAYDMLDALDEVPTLDKLEHALLNGADNWTHYAYAGCGTCYTADIIRNLFPPSTVEKYRHGNWCPRHVESWLDFEARARYQAYILIRRCMRETA